MQQAHVDHAARLCRGSAEGCAACSFVHLCFYACRGTEQEVESVVAKARMFEFKPDGEVTIRMAQDANGLPAPLMQVMSLLTLVVLWYPCLFMHGVYLCLCMAQGANGLPVPLMLMLSDRGMGGRGWGIPPAACQAQLPLKRTPLFVG